MVPKPTGKGEKNRQQIKKQQLALLGKSRGTILDSGHPYTQICLCELSNNRRFNEYLCLLDYYFGVCGDHFGSERVEWWRGASFLTLHQVTAQTAYGHIPNSGEIRPKYCLVLWLFTAHKISYKKTRWISILYWPLLNMVNSLDFITSSVLFNYNLIKISSYLRLMLDNMRYGPRSLSYPCIICVFIYAKIGFTIKLLCWSSLFCRY